MRVSPVGKWLQIEFEVKPGVVVLTGLVDQPQIATVVAAGPTAGPDFLGSRILFKKNAATEEVVDGERVVLLHEDQVLAVLPSPAACPLPRDLLPRGLDGVDA